MTPLDPSHAGALDLEPQRRAFVSLAYLPLAAIAGTFLWLSVSSSGVPIVATAEGLTRLEPPLELPAFALTSHNGSPLGRETLEGRWSLLLIGFASCPDICPNTLSILSSAVNQVDPSGHDVQVLFVSVDPERDSPERLQLYARHFGEFVVGATGSHEQLRKLTRPLGLFYEQEVNAPSDSSYTVEHSTTLIVIDPAGNAVGLIGSHGRDEETVVAALIALKGSSR